MSLELYAAYVVACIVIVLIPGPTVTLIIASSIRHGTRAGLANAAGTQIGVAAMIAIVGIGLNQMIEAMGHWFEWVRLLGAAYLIWLGIQMFRSGGALAADDDESNSGRRLKRGTRECGIGMAAIGLAKANIAGAMGTGPSAFLRGRPTFLRTGIMTGL